MENQTELSVFTEQINSHPEISGMGVKAKIKYETPRYDAALESIGFDKFETHPVYYRKEEDYWRICFHVDWKAYQLAYEEMDKRKDIKPGSYEFDLNKLIESSFVAICASTLCKTLEYRWLLVLTADFYYHNGDKEMHEKYVILYEKLTGKKYRD